MLKRPTPFARWPLWYGGFRPFFWLTAAVGVAGVFYWGGVWQFGWPVPGQANGPIVWHAHEMLYGMVLASAMGFLLTALPEFTRTGAIAKQQIVALVLVWVLARIGFHLPGAAGNYLAALCDVTLVVWLLLLTIPRLLSTAGRQQAGFGWGLAALLLVTLGFHGSVLTGGYPLRWLNATVGVWMILIIVALSRISMRIVNAVLKQQGVEDKAYIARPPRRNLAILCIGLFTLAEWSGQTSSVQGWLAIAGAAALLNLTNDWHVDGRALRRRWVALLYGVYWCMALGYALMGWALLTGEAPVSAGRHVLMIGAMGLSMLAVLSIAGRSHTGRGLDERRWLMVAILLVPTAMIARWVWAYSSGSGAFWFAIAAWCLAFALYLVYFSPVLLGPRPDGRMDASGPS